MNTEQVQVVRVLGDVRRIAGVGLHLPASWLVRPARDLDEVEGGDVVLLVRPHVSTIASVSSRLPHTTTLVVLLDRFSPALDIAVALDEGADRCVREGSLALLASHLMAGHRRLVLSAAAG
jgi:hypothetical protein